MDSIQICSYDGCDRTVYRKRTGLCGLHAAWKRRGREPQVKDMSVEWRSVVAAPMYEVSADGRVWSNFGLGREVKQLKNPITGYWGCGITHETGRRTRTIHVMVAQSFHGTRPEGDHCVRHLDGNKDNNAVANLAWGTNAENRLDAVAHGTHYSHFRGITHCHRGHEFTPENTKTYGGRRHCQACRATYTRVRSQA